MDGEECLADIRDEDSLTDIPVIMYSTSFDEEKINILKEKGADRYLQKPSSYTELITGLRCTIESIEAQESKMDNFIVRY
jgi:DNA-binding response OmpR family regulator